jgi:hypothetical protein
VLVGEIDTETAGFPCLGEIVIIAFAEALRFEALSAVTVIGLAGAVDGAV